MKKEWNDLEQKESHVAKEWQNLEQSDGQTKKKWQNLKKEPGRAGENSIKDRFTDLNSWLLPLFFIVGILLSIALLFCMIFFCVAVVIIGTDLCV